MEKRCDFDVATILSKKERILRRVWVGLLIAGLVAAALPLIAACAGPNVLNAYVIGYLASPIILQLPSTLGLYHCVYRRYGTRYLTFVLCLTIIIAIPSVIPVIGRSENPTELIIIVPLILSLWIFLFLAMRKINKKILKHIFEEESQAIQRFQNSDNLEDLKRAYIEEKRKWPQVKRYVSKAYKNRKKVLSA